MIPNWRMHAIVVLTISSGSALAAEVTVVRVGPQIRIDVNGGTAAANETAMASMSLNPNEIVAAWNDWRDSTYPHDPENDLLRMGVAVSSDGGATWADFLIRPPLANQANHEGDPMTAYDDRTGTLWVGAIALDSPNGGPFVARKIRGQNAFEPSVMAHVTGNADKGLMAAGPAPGDPGATYLYIAYNGGVIVSHDMGDSWLSPVPLGDGIGFLPRVGPDGELYVLYSKGDKEIVLRRSLVDGGQTFGDLIPIAMRKDSWNAYDGTRFPGIVKVMSLPYLAVDRNSLDRRGWLYCVYFDTTGARPDESGNYNVDLYFTRSTNEGLTWTTPVVINGDSDPPGDQFFPWIEVDELGVLHMVFMDSRHTEQNDDVECGMFDVYYSFSDDGGDTWHETRLTPASFNGCNDGLNYSFQFLGDYFGLGRGKGRVYPCYVSSQNGDTDIFTHIVDVCQVEEGYADCNDNDFPDVCDPHGVIYVDDDAPNDPVPGDPTVSDPNEDGSPDHPFDAIQEGINATYCVPGQEIIVDTVVVRDGLYTGVGNKNLDFGGRRITVRSENGPPDCVIDCQNNGRGFFFHTGETSAARVEGLTIRNGNATTGGGVYTVLSSPIISGCVIKNSQATDGGGVAISGGATTIENCKITGNDEESHGAGIYATASAVTIRGCDISDNDGTAMYIEGGGATADILNLTVASNAGNGIVVENGPDVSVCNSIVWGNTGDEILVTSGSLSVQYSDIDGGWIGTGNINEPPLFIDPPDNLHLPANSPCVDAGNNDCVTGTGFTEDLDGNPRIIDGDSNGTPTVDMGAYESCYDASQCSDFDACTCNSCENGICTFTPRPYGDVNCDGTVNVFDVFAIQAAIGGGYYDKNLDIHPCAGNGVLSVLDMLAVLDAIAGTDPCCSE